MRIDYARFRHRLTIGEILEFEWAGSPSPRIIPQYVAWMHTVMCEVAQHLNQRILYFYPACHGGGHAFIYKPDGSYERAK